MCSKYATEYSISIWDCHIWKIAIEHTTCLCSPNNKAIRWKIIIRLQPTFVFGCTLTLRWLVTTNLRYHDLENRQCMSVPWNKIHSSVISPFHPDPGDKWCLCTAAFTTTHTTTCTTTTAVASVLSAILVACISAVIHIAVCVYYGRTKKINHTTHSAGDVNTVHTEAVYEQVSEGNEVLEMKQNQAYSSFPLQQ